jgi:hypothetical protein
MRASASFISSIGAELVVAPVVAHLGVDEVLVDRGQLGGEHLVEDLDDLGVAVHVRGSQGSGRGVPPVGRG